MKSSVIHGALVAAVLAMVACGSSGGTTTTPTPVPSGVVSSNATQINILGERGGNSFTPNPAPSGLTTVQFMNTDGETHHIVANDGSFDSGNIAPGQASPVLSLTTDGTNYHCSIHPTMIGSMDATDGAPPPCRGAYC
jgi:plastocyanin